MKNNKNSVVILKVLKFEYPKLEIVRKGNSENSICKKESFLALATDTMIKNIEKQDKIKILDLNNTNEMADFVLEYYYRVVQ